MKTKLLFLFIFSQFFFIGAIAQSKIITADIKVYGNCVMCKKRIETALDHAGLKKAVWDIKTKNLRIVYNSSKVNEHQICELVAAAGHDTDSVKATDEAYALLPFCCLYRDHDHGAAQKGTHN
jgi:mercuric ion binding protein